MVFPQNKYGVTKPKRGKKIFNLFNLGVVGRFFFVVPTVVRSYQKPIYECNLESSFLSNGFIVKDF